MNNENMKYLMAVKEELEKYYNGFEDEDGNEYGLADYICENVLDTRYIVESNFELRSCMLYVTLGGPTVWIDTETRTIEIRWGSEKESLWLDSDICDAIDDFYTEIFNCR